jgi:ABC-type multidrug transport system fused ATPase/permease subunit
MTKHEPHKTDSLWQLIIRLWHAISTRHRRQFFILLTLMVIGSFAEVISIGAVLPFLAALLSPESVFKHSSLLASLIDFNELSPKQIMLLMTVAFCATSLIAGAIRLLLLHKSVKFSFGLGSEISQEVYSRSLYQPYSVHVSRNSSEIINAIAVKTNEVIFYIIGPVMTMISALFLSIAIIATLTVVVPLQAIGSLFVFGIFYALVMVSLRSRLQRNSHTIAKESTKSIRCLQEGLGGIRDILLDRSQICFVSSFKRHDEALRQAQRDNQFIAQSPRFVIETLGMVFIAFLALALSNSQGGLVAVIPTLAALALGLQRLLPSLQQSYQAWSTIKGAEESLRETLKLLEQPITAPPTFELNSLKFEKSIRVDGLCFRYLDEAPWILEGFNLEIIKGSRLGFVGETGSGKSTLLDIIMGLLHPTRGELLIDGVPVTPANVDRWRPHVAHVPQDIFLADGTVRQNIAFGVDENEIDDESVSRAAHLAHIGSTIEGWTLGYETVVGERGVQLSGGQRQRIGIARALYKKADLFVFDEATSALDSDTEDAVMRSIESLPYKITILVIAHRLSTLKNCDRIIEIENKK